MSISISMKDVHLSKYMGEAEETDFTRTSFMDGP